VANSNEPGRREANKLRTRAAVYDALVELLATESIDTLTAERVADVAGISRRTFFNYFPSIEAVLAHRQQEVLDQLRRFLVRRPVGESLLDGAVAAADELFTVDLLTETTRLWQAIDRSPAATRYTLEVSQEVLVDLAHDWVGQRAPFDAEPDDLRISVFTAACMAAFDAARRAWLAEHHGPVDAAARDEFLAKVHRAFGYLRPSVEQESAPTDDPES
jgi:AcrR family transcriptional regulator